MTTDKDKLLNFDFHFAVCLLAIEELTEALEELYASIWLLTSGDDTEADKFYRSTYHRILRDIADRCAFLTVTDEYRQQYEDQNNG